MDFLAFARCRVHVGARLALQLSSQRPMVGLGRPHLDKRERRTRGKSSTAVRAWYRFEGLGQALVADASSVTGLSGFDSS